MSSIERENGSAYVGPQFSTEGIHQSLASLLDSTEPSIRRVGEPPYVSGYPSHNWLRELDMTPGQFEGMRNFLYEQDVVRPIETDPGDQRRVIGYDENGVRLLASAKWVLDQRYGPDIYEDFSKANPNLIKKEIIDALGENCLVEHVPLTLSEGMAHRFRACATLFRRSPSWPTHTSRLVLGETNPFSEAMDMKTFDFNRFLQAAEKHGAIDYEVIRKGRGGKTIGYAVAKNSFLTLAALGVIKDERGARVGETEDELWSDLKSQLERFLGGRDISQAYSEALPETREGFVSSREERPIPVQELFSLREGEPLERDSSPLPERVIPLVTEAVSPPEINVNRPNVKRSAEGLTKLSDLPRHLVSELGISFNEAQSMKYWAAANKLIGVVDVENDKGKVSAYVHPSAKDSLVALYPKWKKRNNELDVQDELQVEQSSLPKPELEEPFPTESETFVSKVPQIAPYEKRSAIRSKTKNASSKSKTSQRSQQEILEDKLKKAKAKENANSSAPSSRDLPGINDASLWGLTHDQRAQYADKASKLVNRGRGNPGIPFELIDPLLNRLSPSLLEGLRAKYDVLPISANVNYKHDIDRLSASVIRFLAWKFENLGTDAFTPYPTKFPARFLAIDIESVQKWQEELADKGIELDLPDFYRLVVTGDLKRTKKEVAVKASDYADADREE